VASPSDTQEERERLEAVVDELNRGVAAERDLILELLRWETHVRPGIGEDSQAVINAQIPPPDIVVAIFWKRLGTATPRGGSGTAEEILAVLDAWATGENVELLTYFNQQRYLPTADDLDQLGRLLAFREDLQNRGVLVSTYAGPSDFEAKVREHLSAAVRAWKPLAANVAGETLPLARTTARSPTALAAGSPAEILSETEQATVWPSFPYERVCGFFSTARSYIRILQTWLPDAQPFGASFVRALTQGASIQILIQDPDSSSASQRAVALGLEDQQYAHYHLRKMLADLRRAESEAGGRATAVRVYDDLPLAQIYGTEDRMWIGLFWPNRFSMQGPQIEIPTTASSLGQEIQRYFEILWAAGAPLEADRSLGP
jgi:hypothetical protein